MSYNPQSRHYSVLKKLFPLPLEGDLDVALDAEGLALDRAEDRASRLHLELFPDTASSDPVLGTLTDWERIYGIVGDTSKTDQERGTIVVAKMRNLGGLNRAAFYRIAQALGYNPYPSNVDPHIQILDGVYRPFRVGFGKVGDAVYFNDHGYSIWTVYVKGTGVESDDVLQSIFEDRGRPGCDFIFVNV
jgi:uncharacterized protein YmfQ (DUF2313 family)